MPSEKFQVAAVSADAMALRPNRNLAVPSRVTVFARATDALARMGLQIGGVVYAQDAAPSFLAAGGGPSVSDDLLADGVGAAGAPITIPVTAVGAGVINLLVVIEPLM